MVPRQIWELLQRCPPLRCRDSSARRRVPGLAPSTGCTGPVAGWLFHGFSLAFGEERGRGAPPRAACRQREPCILVSYAQPDTPINELI